MGWNAIGKIGGAVDSVNGQTGEVLLDTDDVPEGESNRYFTAERVDNRVRTANYSLAGAWSFQRDITVAGVTVGLGPVGTANNASNLALGTNAMPARTTATTSTAIGTNALFNLEAGSHNLAIGANALRSIVSSASNTAIGSNAFWGLTSGTANIALGDAAGRDLIYASGSVYIGANAGLSGSGNESVAVGNNSGMYYRGDQMVAVGQGAFTCSAASPGYGQFSTALGWSAGNISRGGNNTFVGARAGLTAVRDNASTTSEACTFIGSGAGQGSPVQLSYATAIGTAALVTTSNTVVLGRTTDNTVLGAAGDDGSGAKLQVTGAIKSTTEFRVGANKVLGARDTGWGAVSGIAQKGGGTTYTAPTISASPTQAEVQAMANALQDAHRTIKALTDALISHGIIGA